MHTGICALGTELYRSGFDPAFMLVQIPADMGETIEAEMQVDPGWTEFCQGIALTADGHRKEISLYGVRVYWKIKPPPSPW